MTQEQSPTETKARAFFVFQTLREQKVPSWPRLAQEILTEELGISGEEVFDLVTKYTEAHQFNKLPGGVKQLPEIRKMVAEEPFTDLELGAYWFALGYAEQAVGKPPTYGLGLAYWGKWWLSNDENDTKALVDWMKQNPEKVADYLDWGQGEPLPTINYTPLEFRQKAQSGQLQDPLI